MSEFYPEINVVAFVLMIEPVSVSVWRPFLLQGNQLIYKIERVREVRV